MLNAIVVIIASIVAASAEGDFSLLTETKNFSLLGDKPAVDNLPIPDHGPDQFAIAGLSAIVEFYDGSKGPTEETVELLQNLKNNGYVIERAKVVDGKSRLAAYLNIKKLPTFVAILDQREIARVEGIPSNEQLAKMYKMAKDRETIRDAALYGQMIYFSERSFYPCREAKDLLQWLLDNGCDVRRANYDDPSHRHWFESYKVKDYPVFILIDENGDEISRRQGELSLILLRYMKSTYERENAKKNDGKTTNKAQSRTGPVLLDFWADWCIPCHEMDPVIDNLISKGYNVQKINVEADENKATAAKYGATELPLYVVLNSNGTESSRTVGKSTQSTLEWMLRNAR
jgi:thioredoxin 1